MLVFTGCGTLSSPQGVHQKRQRLLEAYDTARQRHNPDKVKQAVKDVLVGKWQYVSLEVEKGSTVAQNTGQAPQRTADTSDATNEQATASDASNPKESEQAQAADTSRLPPIEVTDEIFSQETLGAKAALVASTRQNLTIEFFEDRSSYFYRCDNSGTNATGQCYITTKQQGDDPIPFIRFNRSTGPEMISYLFGSDPIKQMAAREKPVRALTRYNHESPDDAKRNRALTRPPMRRAPLKETSFLMAGITVTEDRLDLVLYGNVASTPKGWIGVGGLRCTFKRIE